MLIAAKEIDSYKYDIDDQTLRVLEVRHAKQPLEATRLFQDKYKKKFIEMYGPLPRQRLSSLTRWLRLLRLRKASYRISIR